MSIDRQVRQDTYDLLDRVCEDYKDDNRIVNVLTTCKALLKTKNALIDGYERRLETLKKIIETI